MGIQHPSSRCSRHRKRQRRGSTRRLQKRSSVGEQSIGEGSMNCYEGRRQIQPPAMAQRAESLFSQMVTAMLGHVLPWSSGAPRTPLNKRFLQMLPISVEPLRASYAINLRVVCADLMVGGRLVTATSQIKRHKFSDEEEQIVVQNSDHKRTSRFASSPLYWRNHCTHTSLGIPCRPIV